MKKNIRKTQTEGAFYIVSDQSVLLKLSRSQIIKKSGVILQTRGHESDMII